MLLDIVISSLISGSTYALLAIGFSLIFGVARIVNIAHTAFYMLSSYFIFFVTHRLGVTPILAMILAIVLAMLLGVVCYKFFIEPIREHEAAVLIATIALALIFQETMLLFFSGEYRSVPPLARGYLTVLGVKITYQQFLTIGIVFLVLAGTWWLLMKTKLGLAIRAVAQDREIAGLMGMSESRIAELTITISVGLAAFAGAVVVPLTVINPFMWMNPLIMMMAVVVLGGMGSLKGSFIGAYILSLAEALVVFLLPRGAFLKEPVALSIMILVLVLRPEGLFGVAFEEER